MTILNITSLDPGTSVKYGGCVRVCKVSGAFFEIYPESSMYMEHLPIVMTNEVQPNVGRYSIHGAFGYLGIAKTKYENKNIRQHVRLLFFIF